MKLFVYKMKDGIEKSWDDVDIKNECEIVEIIEGENNQECEKIAAKNYGDTDIYGWTYSEELLGD